jgi:RNA polymerase sigma-70 factor (ECF subfamily)
VKARDADAWRRLVRLYSPVVFGWCRQRGLQSEDAADVLQEVFQAVFQHIADFRRERPGDSFRGWLWTITQNKLHDHFCRRGAQPQAAGGTDAQQRLAELPAEPAEDSSGVVDASSGAAAGLSGMGPVLRSAVEQIRAEFEDRTWLAFWQSTVDRRLPADVAADLGMSVNAVYKARSRVLRRLREELVDLL